MKFITSRLRTFALWAAPVLALVAIAYFKSPSDPPTKGMTAGVSLGNDVFPRGKELRKGNLGGIPIAVRKEYLQFNITYRDKSDWEPLPAPDYYEKKGYGDSIQGLSLDVDWPTMEPHRPSNDESWRAYRARKLSNWMGVIVNADFNPKARPPFMADNPLARILGDWMERLDKYPSKQLGPDGKFVTLDLRKEYRGLDKNLELHVATTIGKDSDKPDLENNTLYWRGDPKSIVETLIRCNLGKPQGKVIVRRCEHHFEMAQFGAHVELYYTDNLLPHWKTLEIDIQNFIASLEAKQ
jgi:hypothetical protein